MSNRVKLLLESLDVEQYRLFYCSHSDKEVIDSYKITKTDLAELASILKLNLTKAEKQHRRELNAFDNYGMSWEEHQKQVQQKREQTNILRYGNTAPSRLEEFKNKTLETNRERYGVDNVSQASSVKEKRKQTNLEKYGCESFLNSLEYRKKFEDITEERYGYRNPFQSSEKQEEIKKTIKNKYGVDNVFKNEAIQAKSKKTNIEKYGTPYYSQTDEFKDRFRKSSLKHFGVENPSQSDEVKNRIKETNQVRYGVAWTGQLDNCKNKRKQTCIDRYGVEHPWKCPTIQEKIHKTNIDRYGTPYYNNEKFRRVRYIYDGIQFDSSYELYYYIWAIENGCAIKRCNDKCEYTVKGKIYHYTPDFIIDNTLVEIKGKHFFDSEENLINPFSNNADIQAVYKAKGECMKQLGVKIITDITKQIEYVDNKYTSNYIPLFREDIEFPYPNSDLKVKTPTGLIQHFHKSIYYAHRENCISPIDAWNDKSIIKKSAVNRLKYVNSCKPRDILQGFNVAKFAPKVSVFSPNLATELIKKYIKSSNIIDPFSGFSGRMLGALQNNRKYTGYDINNVHVDESNSIISYLHAENMLSVSVKDIFTSETYVYQNTALFTCPPYNLKEQWNENETNLSCDEWIDICLEKYICNEYLFVVDNTVKYKDNVVETITNKSHFGSNSEYIIYINKKD